MAEVMPAPVRSTGPTRLTTFWRSRSNNRSRVQETHRGCFGSSKRQQGAQPVGCNPRRLIRGIRSATPFALLHRTELQLGLGESCVGVRTVATVVSATAP